MQAVREAISKEITITESRLTGLRSILAALGDLEGLGSINTTATPALDRRRGLRGGTAAARRRQKALPPAPRGNRAQHGAQVLDVVAAARGTIRTPTLVEALGLSKFQVQRALVQLVDEGKVERQGVGRGTEYIAVSVGKGSVLGAIQKLRES